MADTCCELTWLLSLLKTFAYQNMTHVSLSCDNLVIINLHCTLFNHVFHERTKYIKIDCHLVREKLQLGIITTQHVNFSAQLADLFFTKALVSNHLTRLLFNLGVYNLFKPPNLREDVTDISV